MILIVDAGISADDPSNKYWRQASENNLLIQSSMNPDKYRGALTTTVYNNHSVFLDFFSVDACMVWEEGLDDLFDQVPYDGLWFDMNEITAFCDGECPEGPPNKTNSTTEPFGQDQWYMSFPQNNGSSTYFLPFIPGKHFLDFMTMSGNATHPSNNLKTYDTHSLFGHV